MTARIVQDHGEQLRARPDATLGYRHPPVLAQVQGLLPIGQHLRGGKGDMDIVKAGLRTSIEDAEWQMLQAILLKAFSGAMTTVPEHPRRGLPEVFASMLQAHRHDTSTLCLHQLLESFTADIQAHARVALDQRARAVLYREVFREL